MSTANFVISLVKNIVTSRNDVSITSITEVVLGDSSKHFVSIPSIIKVCGKYLENDRPFEQSFFYKKNIGKTKLDMGNTIRKLFLNEKLVYEKLCPIFESISGTSLPRPKYYGASQDYVLLEDLGACGFKVENLKAGLDKEHSIHVLEKLSWFHACSLKLKQDSPDVFDAISEESPLGDKYITINSGHAQSALQMAMDALSKTGLHEVADHVKEHNLFSVDSLKKFLKCEPEDESLLVFIHGDCWGNNMMFKHSGELVKVPESEDLRRRILDFKFIDYQAVRRSSALTDVLTFLGTTVNSSLFKSDLKNFLEIYHKSLLDACQQIEVMNPPSWELFWREFQNISKYALIALVWYLPVHSIDFVPNTDWTAVDPDDVSDVIKGADLTLYESKLFDYASALSEYFMKPVN